ncbi:MAG: hypothetical protein KKG92_06980 [Gammaproteobacteria bacterium]|nr:hypothetical protein [Gammaproteobacteria bacterium]
MPSPTGWPWPTGQATANRLALGAFLLECFGKGYVDLSLGRCSPAGLGQQAPDSTAPHPGLRTNSLSDFGRR